MLEGFVRIAVAMDALPSAAGKVSDWPVAGADPVAEVKGAAPTGPGYVARRLAGMVGYFIEDFLADGGSLV